MKPHDRYEHGILIVNIEATTIAMGEVKYLKKKRLCSELRNSGVAGALVVVSCRMPRCFVVP